MKKIIFILLLTFLPGCSALKEKTGEFVTEAVVQKITNDVEEVLDRRGLSIDEIQAVADLNDDGETTTSEMFDTVKESAKDFALLETRNFVERKFEEWQAGLVTQEQLESELGNELVAKGIVTKEELETNKSQIWLYIVGAFGSLISTYLGKQVWSAKQDGKRDQRIAALEKAMQKDIDGDGKIG